MNEIRHVRSRVGVIKDVILAAVMVSLCVIAVDLILSFNWTPRTVPFGDGEALYYPWSAAGVIAGISAVFLVAGFVLGMERQFHNWLLVASGAGLLILGTSYAATERVIITSEELAVRRWWVMSREWRYEDLDAIRIVEHRRAKGANWVTVRCDRKAGGSEEVGAPRLLSKTFPTLRQRAAPKGVVVAWTSEWR
ncbi:MAG: hypothetical protein L0241_24230 [Planctomycetia bacterium]|nr:hypothetical protein [Planctomycetia bacterium]